MQCCLLRGILESKQQLSLPDKCPFLKRHALNRSGNLRLDINLIKRDHMPLRRQTQRQRGEAASALKLRREITEAITNFIIVTFWASESALTIVRAAGKKIKLFVIRLS